jgi:Ca2+-transporting ATPase
VDAAAGLSSGEARARRRRYGPNRLREVAARPGWRILLEQFKSVVVIILAIASALSFAFGDLPEGIALLAVVLVNGGIGFFSEWRATRSMEALRKIGRPRARVRRDGRDREVSAAAIVPGDVLLLEAGDVAAADVRLVEANGLTVDESALTGESVGVAKGTEAVEAEAPLAERANMLFKGTTITEGSAEGVVVATGMATELGRISQLTEDVVEELTPLEQRLERLGRRMAWLVLCAAAVIAVAGIWVGHPVRLIVATSIALGVAAVPEGLPIVANLALARGMWLMSRRNALINRLPAVEALGATDVIFTDKTGTLTENRMALRKVVTAGGETDLGEQGGQGGRQGEPEDPLLARALEVGVLCANASLPDGDGEEDKPQGDPTEVALLRGGARFGLSRRTLLTEKPETREESFDPEAMMMATFHRAGGGERRFEVAVKGAPHAVLEACATVAPASGDGAEPLSDDDRAEWAEKAERLARQGLRVLALADRLVDDDGVAPYEDLRLLGLVGLYDPPREGVDELIRSCRQAGVRVVMVTGDQPQTAHAIARQVAIVDDAESRPTRGRDLPEAEALSEERRRRILDTAVFARFSPAQKLRLVEIFQSAGHVVAMTGDGINDSPALKKADIGVAMGLRGTDAAREASDMVLQDDAFSSIVSAIRQGRVIFGNIRKSVMFMLCTNVAEVLAVAGASVSGAPLPLLPLQILYLNMITDVFPALALGVGKGSPDIMQRPPRRPGESILTRRHWLAVGGWGAGIAACVLAALAAGVLWLRAGEPAAVTVSFLTLGFAKLWFVYNLRDRRSHWLRNTILRNRWVWAAIALCAVLLLAAVYLPGLSALLRTRAIGWAGWAVVLALSALPVLAGQVIRRLRKAKAGTAPDA